MSEGQAKVDLVNRRDLLLKRPGRFRIVVFAVTSQPNFQPDPSARLPALNKGGQVLSENLAAQPLDGKHVLALVYPFERARHAYAEPGQRRSEHHAASAGRRASGRSCRCRR